MTRDWETGESFDPDSDWPAYFQEDPTFDLGNHVKYIGTKNSGMSRDEMLAYLATVINKPPCLDRPPWEVLVRGHTRGVCLGAEIMAYCGHMGFLVGHSALQVAASPLEGAEVHTGRVMLRNLTPLPTSTYGAWLCRSRRTSTRAT